MNILRRTVISLLIAAAVSAVFSWPLARYMGSGIPSSSSNVEKDNVRAMIPGDHLQFLYHMWLAKDTFIGQTPLFHNLYEFNTGDDAERYSVTTYYLPFSLFFTAGTLVGGQAFGWNVTIFITFWLTYVFAWKLARRYQPDEAVAAIAALVSIILPFTWIVILGGSPTGFSMMWVPILLYGIDRWVGEKSVIGAALTGAAIYFSGWSDTHVFFFSALITPCWCLVAYLHHYGWKRPAKADWIGWLRSSVFLALFAGLVLYKAMGVQEGLQSTAIAKGRTLHEVSLFSHGIDGLVSLKSDGDDRKIYVGLYGLLLLAATLVLAIRDIRRDRGSRRGWCLLLLVLGIGGIFLLATGVKNPFGPRAWQMLMKAVPPYGMIRQPDKIFCLLPALMTVVAALAFSGTGLRRATVLRGAAGVLIVPLAFDYAARMNPTVCLLDHEQGAYRAAAEDAAERGEVPRAVVIPLWPGNSHYSSLYQYYVSLYRIRMVNGYRPTPRQPYLESTYEPLESINLGYPTDAQLDDLLSRGVRHVLLHEDAFPEKVSSFPVEATLFNLLRHPRLDLLTRDGPVWCFVIRDEPAEATREVPDLPVLFPVRYWDWERTQADSARIVEDASAINGRFLHVDARLPDGVATKSTRTAGPYAFAWHVRVRGAGAGHIEATMNGTTIASGLRVGSDEWTWLRFPVARSEANARHQLAVFVDEGSIDLDLALLTSADWIPPEPGESLIVPGIAFFRAGYTTDELDGVVFRTRYDPEDEIFYSRNLYLLPGRYRVTMALDSEAPAGTPLGAMIVKPKRGDQPGVEAPVIAGQVTQVEYDHPDDGFFRFAFRYGRNAEVVIRSVSFERLR